MSEGASTVTPMPVNSAVFASTLSGLLVVAFLLFSWTLGNAGIWMILFAALAWMFFSHAVKSFRPRKLGELAGFSFVSMCLAWVLAYKALLHVNWVLASPFAVAGAAHLVAGFALLRARRASKVKTA